MAERTSAKQQLGGGVLESTDVDRLDGSDERARMAATRQDGSPS
jgi:hypothetical protein